MLAQLPAASLQDALAPITSLLTEAVVRPQPEGLVLHALTTDRTASVTVTIPAESFHTYSLGDHDGDCTFGINCERVDGIMSLFSTDTTITSTSPPRSDRVVLSSQNAEYAADRINPASIRQRPWPDTPPVPATLVSVPSPSTPIRRSLTAADLCGETITIRFQCREPILRFTASGDTDRMRQPMTSKQVLAYREASGQATYSVDKLRTMYDAVAPLTEQLQFAIDTTAMLRIMGTHTETGIQIQYTLEAIGEGIVPPDEAADSSKNQPTAASNCQ